MASEGQNNGERTNSSNQCGNFKLSTGSDKQNARTETSCHETDSIQTDGIRQTGFGRTGSRQT